MIDHLLIGMILQVGIFREYGHFVAWIRSSGTFYKGWGQICQTWTCFTSQKSNMDTKNHGRLCTIFFYVSLNHIFFSEKKIESEISDQYYLAGPY